MQINGEQMSRRIQYEDEDRDCYTQISGRNNMSKKQEIISQQLDTHSMHFDSQFYTSNLHRNQGSYMSQYNNNDNEIYEQHQYNLDQDEIAQYDCANDKVKHPYGSKRIRTIQFITINNTHHRTNKNIKNLNGSSSKPKLKILSSSRKRDPTQSTFAYKTIYSQLKYEKITNNVGIKMKQENQMRAQQGKINSRKRGSLSIGENVMREIAQNQMNNMTALEQNIQIQSNKQVNRTPVTKSRNQPIIHSSRLQQKTKQFDSQTTHQNNNQPSNIVNQTAVPTNSKSNNSGNDVNMSKVVSQIIIQNNEYLHRMNESVVNRLLSIIQNTQNATIALQNSRWTQSNTCHQMNPNKNHNSGSNEPNSAFFNDNTQYNNGQPINDFSARRRDYSHVDTSHNNSSNKVVDQEEKLSIKNPHIVINNLIPTSTKSQPHSHNVSLISNGNMNGKQLETEIKIKESELSKLENKRRYRQFNMRTPRVSNCSIADNYQSEINQDTFRSNINNITHNMVDSSVLEEQNSQIKHKRNRESVSLQCDQILQAPMQNQKQEFSESFQPTFGNHNHRNMSKTRKVKQVQASKLSVNENHLMSNTAPNIPLRQYSSQSNILRQNTQKSVQLPVTNKNNVSKVISVEQNLNISNLTQKLPVFMQIPSGEEQNNLGSMTLAQAFKKRIGKLPSRAQRKAKEMQKQNENKKLQQQRQQKSQTLVLKQRVPNKNSLANRTKRTRNKIDQTNNLELDVRALNGKSQDNSYFKTPKSREPSEQLLNRLIGGSVAKISKKQMYALTRKNYQNLPQVLEKKKKEEKKQLQAQRLQRIKQYQKSIRASKTTITSNN